MMNKVKKGTKKVYRKCQMVDLHVNFGMNNTIITVTDLSGQKLFTISPPHLQVSPKFTGPRKATAYAAQEAMKAAIVRMQANHGVVAINAVITKGPGAGRDVALRSIKIPVSKFTDVSPVVHNGTRPPAMRSK